VPKYLVRTSILSMRIYNHIAFASSICEVSSCLDKVRRDALMEECDVWETLVGSKTDRFIFSNGRFG
jgi:hypothetical protein